MSATRSAVNKPPVDRSTSLMQPFVWEGTDKRGVKMKGEQEARNANLLRAELRKLGMAINEADFSLPPEPPAPPPAAARHGAVSWAAFEHERQGILP